MSGLGRRSHYRKHLTDSVLNDFPEPTHPNQRIAKVVGTRGSNQFELIVSPPTYNQHLQQQDGENGINDSNNDNLNKEIIADNEEDKDYLDMTTQLSILPTKYRKLIWLKRNDYVICECAQDDDYDQPSKIKNSSSIEGGIRFMITHILYKDQIKHLKDKNLWPLHSFFSDNSKGVGNKEKEENEKLIEKAKLLLKEQNMNDDKSCDNDYCDEEDRDEGYGETHDYDDDGIVFSNDDDFFLNTNRIAKLKIDDSSSDEDSD